MLAHTSTHVAVPALQYQHPSVDESVSSRKGGGGEGVVSVHLVT